jgi:hypothetical protein
MWSLLLCTFQQQRTLCFHRLIVCCVRVLRYLQFALPPVRRSLAEVLVAWRQVLRIALSS